MIKAAIIKDWTLRSALAGITAAACLAIQPAALHAQTCTPKTSGYFKELETSGRSTWSPSQLAGIANSLTGAIGDPSRGRDVIVAQEKGNCLACHATASLSDIPHHGNLGPSLNGVGSRYTESQLRQLIVDAKTMFPETVMPAFHVPANLPRVPEVFAAKTILTPSEVEDVIAFLKNLK